MSSSTQNELTIQTEHSWKKEAAIVLTLATVVCQLVSFLSPFWGVPRTRDYDPNLEGIGLWKYCRVDEDVNINTHVCVDMGKNQPTFLRTTQALCSIGVAVTILAFIIITASECIKSLRSKPKLVLAFTGLCFTAAVFSGAGVLVFGLDIESQPLEEPDGTTVFMKVGWCFGLSTAAVFLQLICASVGICELIFARGYVEPVEIKVLNFSLSFPGPASRSGSQSPGQAVTNPFGFENMNFENAIIERAEDETST